jgi:hypothetical protein
MSLGTILLIAVAAAVLFLMFRVGRGSHEAAHAHAAVNPSNPDDPGQADPRSHVTNGQDSEGGGRKRHGCC